LGPRVRGEKTLASGKFQVVFAAAS
jgi:hypothetical protein